MRFVCLNCASVLLLLLVKFNQLDVVVVLVLVVGLFVVAAVAIFHDPLGSSA